MMGSESVSVRERLASAGHALPEPSAALGLYAPATRAGGLVFTSGQLPMLDGTLITSGRVGEGVPEDVARRCAAQAALNALAAASTVCDLDEVAGVLKLTGYVAAVPGFTRHSAVIDGASEIMAAAFGDQGRHARAAVGVAGLPVGSPVEVEIVLTLTTG